MIALYILLGLIVLLLLTAAVIGTGWSFEKSILINAPVDKVWGHINTLAKINQWNPWMGKDPNIKVEYSGVDGTPGASFTWDSQDKNVGAGSQTITRVVENSQVASRVNFLRPFKGVGEAFFDLGSEAGASKVTWKIVSSTPYPMNILKLFGVIEKNMDKDFGSGLNKLKALSEQ